MSHNSFGRLFRFTTWGESHGPALGAVVDGCPPGIALSEEDIQPWLDRRRPGTSRFTTQRREPDQVRILSGVFEGRTTGTPISLMIENVDQRSKDYSDVALAYRPGHADYAYDAKYGIERVIGAIRHRTVTPSLILKKLSAYRQQNSLAAALREIGRIERTLFTLRWFEDPALRRTVTAELNKGEARNSLARAVAFHRLGRFRDRGLENQQTRAAALNLVTAAIILFNCRYLGRAVDEMRRRGSPIDPAMLSRLSPLGWDRINLTGDYVWSDHLDLDANGLMPLLIKPLP